MNPARTIEVLLRAKQASEELCQGQDPANECFVTLREIEAEIARLALELPRDISLPWAVVDGRWQWAARDANGEVFLYTASPELSELNKIWLSLDDNREVTGLFANFDPGNKPWDESLIRRPEGS